MCHIGTWSARYCMRTAEKVWRSKVKKNMVYRVSKNDTRQRRLFAECQDVWHTTKIFKFFLKTPSLPSASPIGTRRRILKKLKNTLPSARPGTFGK